MSVSVPVLSKPSQWQLAVASEGIAAAQFARCGFEVTVQSGRDKPSYELTVGKASHLIKVFVKGSQDGNWDLTHSYLKRAADLSGKKANCQWAINQWLDHRGSQSVCCLVQFQGVSIESLPRIHLASAYEIAQKLRESADRLGDATLYEKYEWTPAGQVSPTSESLPRAWAFSEQRIQELLGMGKPAAPGLTLLPHVHSPAGV